MPNIYPHLQPHGATEKKRKDKPDDRARGGGLLLLT
jgi:hypothetical protein